MVVVRLLVFLAGVTIGVSGILYLFTHKRRYLTFAWQMLRFTVIFLVVVGILFVLERLILI